MEELIKRLERVIQTGAPDKDGLHPISAEAVLEVVKQLSEHGTNLAEVGTDCISRQAAIDALCNDYCGGHQDCKYYPNCENLRSVQKLPSAQPAEPKRGKWIDKGWTGDWQYLTDGRGDCWRNIVCSECGESVRHESNFCPNCGADMRGEQNE